MARTNKINLRYALKERRIVSKCNEHSWS